MDHHGGLDLQSGQSLEEDLMQGLRDTGMYDMAADMGLVQDGMMPGVRLHEQWRVTESEEKAGPSGSFMSQGQQLVAEADAAAAAASSVAEEVAARLEAATTRPHSAATSGQSTPTRQRRRRGSAAGQTDEPGAAGGRGGSRGLRHFSMKVCEKVESKQCTTYNEVADELVAELPRTTAASSARQYDEKNIRRRVYDALNVLMAMDIITRQKKDIVWRGLPHNQVTQLERLRADHARLVTHINKQKAYIEELQKQQAAYRGLLHRNKDRPLHALQAGVDNPTPTALPLPFVLIQVDPGAIVEIQISPDSRVAQFDFRSTPFQMVGDEDVLYGLKLHELAPPAADASDASAQPFLAAGRANSDADAATAQQLLAMSAGQGNDTAMPEPSQHMRRSHPTSHNGPAQRQPQQPHSSKGPPGALSARPHPGLDSMVDPHSMPPFQEPQSHHSDAASLWQTPCSNGVAGSSYLYH